MGLISYNFRIINLIDPLENHKYIEVQEYESEKRAP